MEIIMDMIMNIQRYLQVTVRLYFAEYVETGTQHR